ncbi:MAG: N-acetylglucosamine-6-phosphate deacetylase [Clostridiaceae bacterium]
MKTLIQNIELIDRGRIYNGSILVENGVILSCGSEVCVEADAEVVDGGGCYAAPGFIELHAHGAGGFDFMDASPEEFARACKTHLLHGTTTILPTTLTGKFERLYGVIDRFRASRAFLCDGPFTPGLHLEGPYFAMAQRGAQDPRYLKNPDPAEYRALIEYAAGDIARWTVAPELPGALEMGDALAQGGILASMGHTDAEYATVLEATHHGYSHITHLYSCTSTIVRRGGFRYPGVIESAYMLEDLTVEVIADGCHLPPELLNMVYRLKSPERVALISDSLRCAGQDVTESVSGPLHDGQRIIIEDGVAKLPDRSAFAGSIATADRLLRVTHQQAGVPLADCVRMMSETPARILGLSHKKGRLTPGLDADIVLINPDLSIRAVYYAGHLVK